MLQRKLSGAVADDQDTRMTILAPQVTQEVTHPLRAIKVAFSVRERYVNAACPLSGHLIMRGASQTAVVTLAQSGVFADYNLFPAPERDLGCRVGALQVGTENLHSRLARVSASQFHRLLLAEGRKRRVPVARSQAGLVVNGGGMRLEDQLDHNGFIIAKLLFEDSTNERRYNRGVLPYLQRSGPLCNLSVVDPSSSGRSLLTAAALGIVAAWQPWQLRPARAAAPPKAEPAWVSAASKAASFALSVLENHPEAIAPPTKSRLYEALNRFIDGSRRRGLLIRMRSRLSDAKMTAGLDEADLTCAQAARDLTSAYAELPDVIRWTDPPNDELDITAPFGDTTLIIHRPGTGEGPPSFQAREIDFARESDLSAGFPEGPFFGAIVLKNIPAGTARRTITMQSAGKQLALQIRTTVPTAHRTRFRVLGDDGQPTEATVAVYSQGGRFLIPDSALDFSKGGFRYQPTQFKNLVNAKYWPGEDGFERAFFVRGEFELDLPAGAYRVIASKGPEHLAVDERITVKGPPAKPHNIQLKRWTDMSSKGWHSGDCHIHYERLDPSADERLRLWTQAADLRMGNILRMGDARETFFPQRAWGKKGRANWPGLSLVPGQEDPRTSFVGHTISLNLPRPVRFEQTYYLYGNVFDEVRRIGGLAGYAHVHDGNFLVDRDMAISIARGKVDFVEICEFGKIGVGLYYEFLNLGFRLTAAGGSDVPWGARGGAMVGESRVYVHTGRAFDPDEWFEGLKNGRTFVTLGPMIDFTVDGQLPGETLKRNAGQEASIRATAAIGDPLIPFEQLEIIANGKIIYSAQRAGKQSAIEFDLPLEHGQWIAARTISDGQIGAHTTPIYVTVDGDPHWNRELAPRLVENRFRSLNEVEQLIDASGEGIGDGRQGNWENETAFRQGMEELRTTIAEAREVYRQLLRQ